MQHLPIKEPYMRLRRRGRWQDNNPAAGPCAAAGQGIGGYEIHRVVAGHGPRSSVGSKLGVRAREKWFRASFG